MNYYGVTRRWIGAARFCGVALAIAGCGAADVGEFAGGPDGNQAVASTSEALSTVVNASWIPDDVIEGAPVHRQGTNTLDQLLIHSSGQPGRWHRDSSGNWSFEVITGAPAGVRARALAGAYSGGAGALEVFLHGTDGKIYWTFKETDDPAGAWDSWRPINRTTSVKSLSKVAVANRDLGDMDVFWITNSNTIAHVKIDDFAAAAPVSGSSSRPWFQSANGELIDEIRAVAWDANNVDVFVLAGQRIQHIWQVNGSWGTASSPNREVITSTFLGGVQLEWFPRSLVVSSPRPGVIDLIALTLEQCCPIPPAKMATVQYNGTWPTTGGPSPWVTWRQMTVSPSGTPLPAELLGATSFNDNGVSRVNVIGHGGSLDLFDGYVLN